MNKENTSKLKKIWASVGISGLIVIALLSNLIYMNLRSSDPILPGWEEYDAEKFEARMARGEPILIEIYASWCPTCLLQHRAFETLNEEGRTPTIRAIRVDFDRDEEFRKSLGINYTGALLLFNNGKRVTEVAGLITADQLADFLGRYGYMP